MLELMFFQGLSGIVVTARIAYEGDSFVASKALTTDEMVEMRARVNLALGDEVRDAMLAACKAAFKWGIQRQVTGGPVVGYWACRVCSATGKSHDLIQHQENCPIGLAYAAAVKAEAERNK